MSQIQKILPHIIAVMLILFLAGCTGSIKNMQAVPNNSVNTVPKKGKSMIVFLRPSSLGFAIQSSVFEIKEHTPHLVGIVAAKKKVAYELNPGNHVFMVVSESGDFMTADLLANKTYYALVTPRMGLWKARFSLKAISANELSSDQFREWLNDCEWVRKSPASTSWANSNMVDINSKYTENYKRWLSKDPSNKPNLLPEDGK